MSAVDFFALVVVIANPVEAIMVSKVTTNISMAGALGSTVAFFLSSQPQKNKRAKAGCGFVKTGIVNANNIDRCIEKYVER